MAKKSQQGGGVILMQEPAAATGAFYRVGCRFIMSYMVRQQIFSYNRKS